MTYTQTHTFGSGHRDEEQGNRELMIKRLVLRHSQTLPCHPCEHESVDDEHEPPRETHHHKLGFGFGTGEVVFTYLRLARLDRQEWGISGHEKT